jgi:transcriptional regulator with XRE-family HTH domain
MATEKGRSAPSRQPISHPLRAAILARGVSASALARAAGVDPGVVNRYLDGRRGLTLETADKLAAALNLRLVVDPDGAGSIDCEDFTRGRATEPARVRKLQTR